MKKVWTWIKERALWILGGLATVLGAILFLKYERDKIGKLKDDATIARATREVAVLEAKVEARIERDGQLAKEDKDLTERIAELKREAVAVREEVKGRSNAEVVARFNQLYNR